MSNHLLTSGDIVTWHGCTADFLIIDRLDDDHTYTMQFIGDHTSRPPKLGRGDGYTDTYHIDPRGDAPVLLWLPHQGVWMDIANRRYAVGDVVLGARTGAVYTITAHEWVSDGDEPRYKTWRHGSRTLHSNRQSKLDPAEGDGASAVNDDEEAELS